MIQGERKIFKYEEAEEINKYYLTPLFILY